MSGQSESVSQDRSGKSADLSAELLALELFMLEPLLGQLQLLLEPVLLLRRLLPLRLPLLLDSGQQGLQLSGPRLQSRVRLRHAWRTRRGGTVSPGSDSKQR